MKVFLIILSSFFLSFAVYILFWPVPLNPGIFEAPEAPILKGKFQVNHMLASAKEVGKIDGCSLESIAFDSNGIMYAGVSDGRIVRYDESEHKFVFFADTGGHPLGLAFDSMQNLLVADAEKGLLSVSKDGAVKALVTEVAGKPVLFADDLDISPDGMVYFSDASIYPITDNVRMEVLDCRPHGRLISYNPKTGRSEVLLDNLYFANGVTLSPDGSFVLVSETFAYRISRYWLKGPKQGKRDIFIENLPGFPDNITCNGKDRFWVALVSPRSKDLESIQSKPFIRKIMMRLPSSWIPSPEPPDYGFVLGVGLDGKMLNNLQDPNGTTISQITSALEYNNTLYLGNIGHWAVMKIAIH